MSRPLNTVDNTVSLVTGAANGLGQNVVQQLLAGGSAGIVTFDHQFNAEDVVDNQVIVKICGNIDSEADILRAVDVCRHRFGRLDHVINCCTILPPIDGQSVMDQLQRVFNINTVGTFNVIRLAVPLMADNQPVNGCRGVIVNMAPILMAPIDGQRVFDDSVVYSSSSEAIVSMTLPLARDLSHQGIRCLTIRVHFGSNQSDELASSVGHLVTRIIENPMLNGTVLDVDIGSKSTIIPPKL